MGLQPPPHSAGLSRLGLLSSRGVVLARRAHRPSVRRAGSVGRTSRVRVVPLHHGCRAESPCQGRDAWQTLSASRPTTARPHVNRPWCGRARRLVRRTPPPPINPGVTRGRRDQRGATMSAPRPSPTIEQRAPRSVRRPAEMPATQPIVTSRDTAGSRRQRGRASVGTGRWGRGRRIAGHGKRMAVSWQGRITSAGTSSGGRRTRRDARRDPRCLQSAPSRYRNGVSRRRPGVTNLGALYQALAGHEQDKFCSCACTLCG